MCTSHVLATNQARETGEHLFNIAHWISREDHIQKNSAAVLAMDLGVFSYFNFKAKDFALEKQAFTIIWKWIEKMKFNVSRDQSTIDEYLINVFLKRQFYHTIVEAFVQGRGGMFIYLLYVPLVYMRFIIHCCFCFIQP